MAEQRHDLLQRLLYVPDYTPGGGTKGYMPPARQQQQESYGGPTRTVNPYVPQSAPPPTPQATSGGGGFLGGFFNTPTGQTVGSLVGNFLLGGLEGGGGMQPGASAALAFNRQMQMAEIMQQEAQQMVQQQAQAVVNQVEMENALAVTPQGTQTRRVPNPVPNPNPVVAPPARTPTGSTAAEVVDPVSGQVQYQVAQPQQQAVMAYEDSIASDQLALRRYADAVKTNPQIAELIAPKMEQIEGRIRKDMKDLAIMKAGFQDTNLDNARADSQFQWQQTKDIASALNVVPGTALFTPDEIRARGTARTALRGEYVKEVGAELELVNQLDTLKKDIQEIGDIDKMNPPEKTRVIRLVYDYLNRAGAFMSDDREEALRTNMMQDILQNYTGEVSADRVKSLIQSAENLAAGAENRISDAQQWYETEAKRSDLGDLRLRTYRIPRRRAQPGRMVPRSYQEPKVPAIDTGLGIVDETMERLETSPMPSSTYTPGPTEQRILEWWRGD